MKSTFENLDLDILGSKLRVVCDDGKVLSVIGEMWAPFVTSSPDPVRSEVEIRKAKSGWVARTPIRRVYRRDPWNLLYDLRMDMTEVATREAEGIIDLHGAALVHDDDALILIGESGSGKTTISMAMAAAGWELFSDDLSPLDVDSGEVLPFPKPMMIRDAGRWPELAEQWDPPGWLPRPRHTFTMPATVFRVSSRERAPVRYVLFLKRDNKASPSIEDVSLAEALASAAAHTMRLDYAVLQRLRSVFQDAHLGRIDYGEAGHAPGLIGDWISNN